MSVKSRIAAVVAGSALAVGAFAVPAIATAAPEAPVVAVDVASNPVDVVFAEAGFSTAQLDAADAAADAILDAAIAQHGSFENVPEADWIKADEAYAAALGLSTQKVDELFAKALESEGPAQEVFEVELSAEDIAELDQFEKTFGANLEAAVAKYGSEENIPDSAWEEIFFAADAN